MTKTSNIKRTPEQIRNIKRWVKALRSGAYKQTQGALCDWKPGGKESFCCLGVAANELIAGEWRKPGWADDEEEFSWQFSANIYGGPIIYNEIGLLEQEVLDHLFGPGLNVDQLAAMNDASDWYDRSPTGYILIGDEHKHTETKRGFRYIASHIERVTGVKA